VKDVKDFTKYHSEKLGISEKDYVTYYLTNENVEEYDGTWKSYEEDLMIMVGKQFPSEGKSIDSFKKWVKKYEITGSNKDNQPTWELKLKNNLKIIAQRTSRFGSYIITLNGKEYNTQYTNTGLGWDLMKLLLKPIEQYERQIKAKNWNSGYADDFKSWKLGNQHKDSIESIYSELSSGDKKKAYKIHTKEAPKNYTYTDFESFDKSGGR
tara:strand:+ start:703 stop:1332 length:630 start_codon:yes stop_codon:yes gene_type:complete